MLVDIQAKLRASGQLVLASGSPRRREILNDILGLDVRVVPSSFEEDLDKSKFTPQTYVQENARCKAMEVWARLAQEGGAAASVVIGSDTVVAVDGDILEKPKSAEAAKGMLRRLSARAHQVHSGVALVCSRAGGGEPLVVCFHETTEVQFAELGDALIDAYVASGEPMDKAGGYGIQAIGGSFVTGIRGCYYNVMGFPMHRFCAELRTLVDRGDIRLGMGAGKGACTTAEVAVAARTTLNSGQSMPTLGLGTFLATKPGEVYESVKCAVKAGYRLIDCAAGYGNQEEVGRALAELFEEGVVKREELFVVSKLFQTHHAWGGDPARCEATLAQTLKELGLGYLDLFLMHWPFAFAEEKLEKPPGTKQPLRLPDGSPNPIWTIHMEYLHTWRAMEAMVESGRVRSIGVSNFTEEQLAHLIAKSRIPPAVNQVEVHPYLGQEAMLRFCSAQGLRVMGYSPLGSSAQRSPPEHGCTLLKHPALAKIAAEVGRGVGQVLIRWGLQRRAAAGGVFVSIPKSSNAGRIVQNLDVRSWELPAEAMARIDALESGFRYFISYLKKPDNMELWHDGRVESEPPTLTGTAYPSPQ